MSIVLQNRGHLGFIENEAGDWTTDQKLAHVFQSSLVALLYCFEHHLPNMQIRAAFEDSKSDFVIPVADGYAKDASS